MEIIRRRCINISRQQNLSLFFCLYLRFICIFMKENEHRCIKKGYQRLQTCLCKDDWCRTRISRRYTTGRVSTGPETDVLLEVYIWGKMKTIKNDKVSVDLLKIQTVALIDESTAPKMLTLIDNCAHFIDQEDTCKAVYDYAKCVYETDSSLNFLP